MVKGTMRGADSFNETMFKMRRLDDFIAVNHPLRPIREWLNEALVRMEATFSQMYASDARGGRPSIAPEKLIRALLLQVQYSIRSERMLVEQISYNMLFRWFVGLAMDDAVWDASTFSKNRCRLMAHDVVIGLFNEMVETAQRHGYLSGEHFSVDGTLIQAWASHKSFEPKAKTTTRRLRRRLATHERTGEARSAATLRTSRAQMIDRHGCFARAVEWVRCPVIWDTC
jgi:transposase